MPQQCSENYECTPIWYDVTNNSATDGEDVIVKAAGPYAEDVNVVCDVKTGVVQFQVMDSEGEWFTPNESSFTVQASTVVRLPRANMPDVRVIATLDAKFYIEGPLR